jgi:hypothetical protein
MSVLSHLGAWLSHAAATDTPVLPSALAMQIWLHLGWSVVLACVGANLVGRWRPGRPGKLDGWQWGVALVLAVWTWVPGPYSPAYWLGLAFQSPSIAAVLLCDALLRTRFFSTRAGTSINEPHNPRALVLALAGVLAGWALLLDSLALLPVQLYAWGFSPAAVGLVLLLALIPWVVGTGPHPSGRSRVWVVPVAVLVFVVWRLPSGNVWDAVLDPWLWLVLHGVLINRVSRAWRAGKGRRTKVGNAVIPPMQLQETSLRGPNSSELVR